LFCGDLRKQSEEKILEEREAGADLDGSRCPIFDAVEQIKGRSIGR
jgi:hypothetical protein